MCGNGLRCIAAFLKNSDPSLEECMIETPKDPLLKVHRCLLYPDAIFTEMGSPNLMEMDKELLTDGKSYKYAFLNTGTPHAVLFFSEIQTLDVLTLGSKIRFHKDFAPSGTNVNFATPAKENNLSLRTYEKGVERETLACGTGVIAAALCFAKRYNKNSPINVNVAGGDKLIVSFSYKNGRFENVGLVGSVKYLGKEDFPLGNYPLLNYSRFSYGKKN